MGKKLAVLFPGIGYSVDRPLLYYSKKVLKAKGYEIIEVHYGNLKADALFDSEIRKISRDKLISFVAKANELAAAQLGNVAFNKYDSIVFVSKSIGTVVGAVYATKNHINPYHFMFTPIDYALQFVENDLGTAFCGDEDTLTRSDEIEKLCKKQKWDFRLFKKGNHSLETGDVNLDLEYLKKCVTIVENVISGMEESIYDFEIKTRNQLNLSMSSYRGKVLLIVNTATGCGFTPQYQMLENIYRKYHKEGFEILDFPCNQFANQAPGSESDIYSFCTSRYDISFEQFAKICVNGDKQTKLYRFLKARKGFVGFDMTSKDSQYLIHKLEKENPEYVNSSDIKWNFTKFLVDRKGNVIERFEPTTDLALVDEAIAKLI